MSNKTLKVHTPTHMKSNTHPHTYGFINQKLVKLWKFACEIKQHLNSHTLTRGTKNHKNVQQISVFVFFSFRIAIVINVYYSYIVFFKQTTKQ